MQEISNLSITSDEFTLVVDGRILEMFADITIDKSEYIDIMAVSGALCFFCEIKEVIRMSYVGISNPNEFSMRIPTDVLKTVMKIGTLRIVRNSSNNGEVPTVTLTHYTGLDEKTITVEIADELCAERERIASIIGSLNKEGIEMPGKPFFYKLESMIKPNSSKVPITGLQIRDGMGFVISNGYAAYMEAPKELRLTISTSSLRAIIHFLDANQRAELIINEGYCYLRLPGRILGWRRQRPAQCLDSGYIKEIDSCMVDIGNINEMFSHISTEVKECRLQPSVGKLSLRTQLGYYTLPLNAEKTCDVGDYKVNYNILSALLKTMKGTVSFGYTQNTLILRKQDITYILGVSRIE